MFSKPNEPLTPLARHTKVNAFLYLALGLPIYAWPGAMALVETGAFEGQESGLFRIIGFAIAVIGWFYVFGARTNRDSFGWATFGDRMLVPAFVLPPRVRRLGRPDPGAASGNPRSDSGSRCVHHLEATVRLTLELNETCTLRCMHS